MNGISKEEKIQKSFDGFFLLNKGKRRPSDFKLYNRSIYNILCKSYKNEDNKIDRNRILKDFVSKDKRKNFQRTNIYNNKGIKRLFQEFFQSQKRKGKQKRTIGDLNNWNESLVITISRKYGYNGNGFVNREQFIKEYGLDKLGCNFIREAPIHTTITIEAINQEIKDILKNNKYRSPDILHNKKPQYLKRLGKRFRDQDGKIDRLYILYKIIDDIEILKKFRHRYAISRGLNVPNNRTKKKDITEYKLVYNGLNPEEILIEKEEHEIYFKNKEKLYNMISNLSTLEQEVIQNFLSDKEYNQEIFFNIITKFKK